MQCQVPQDRYTYPGWRMNHWSNVVGSSDSSPEMNMLMDRHARLGPRRTLAQRLLINGSTVLLHVPICQRVGYESASSNGSSAVESSLIERHLSSK